MQPHRSSVYEDGEAQQRGAAQSELPAHLTEEPE